MAKANEKNANDGESVQSILGKIRRVVSGKEKVTIEEEKTQAYVPESSADDEDVMELTEIVESTEEETAEVLQPVPEPQAAQQTASQTTTETVVEQAAAEAAPEEEEEANFVDILQEIDQALEAKYVLAGKEPEENTNAEPQAEPQAVVQPEPVIVPPEMKQEPVAQPVVVPIAEAAPEPVVNANVAQEPVKNEPVAAPEPKKEFAQGVSQNIIKDQTGTAMAENKPNILSEDIANKSSKAIQSLLNNIPRPQIDSPAFRSATTLEDLAMEMIKPMMKEWLDKNLETIVRDIVEKEIKKIMPRE